MQEHNCHFKCKQRLYGHQLEHQHVMDDVTFDIDALTVELQAASQTFDKTQNAV